MICTFVAVDMTVSSVLVHPIVFTDSVGEEKLKILTTGLGDKYPYES